MEDSCATGTAKIDHIVVLCPYKALTNPPSWLSEKFFISPGGRHGDNKTENRLILLPDGCYIELIAFIDDDPKLREGHWWGKSRPGVIDVAFTTDADAKTNYQAIHDRLEHVACRSQSSSLGYVAPRPGGRRRTALVDGEMQAVEIKWEVTFPENVKRGVLPFFCHDVTPRDRRVPLSDENTAHACHAYGVKSLTITVDADRFVELAEGWGAALEAKPDISAGESCSFVAGRVRPVSAATHGPRIILRAAAIEQERQYLKDQQVVISDLVFGATDGAKDIQMFGRTEKEPVW